MAWLDRETLTCPGCGASAEVAWVVGEGPSTRAGEGPAYVSATRGGHCVVRPDGPAVAVARPDCDAEVARRAP